MTTAALVNELAEAADLRALSRVVGHYTDPHHHATVPHTLVVAPGLVVDPTTEQARAAWMAANVAQLTPS